jgi:hypothetical protein
MRACSQQLNPFINRVVLIERCPRDNGPPELTPRKRPPHYKYPVVRPTWALKQGLTDRLVVVRNVTLTLAS